MNETGPEATPPVERTTSPEGRKREKEKPVPPPDWWIFAIRAKVSKIPSIESSTGSTKQAESCPRDRPAFISVGELGKKRPSAIAVKYRSLHSPIACPCAPAAATLCATRQNSSVGVSQISPSVSCRR